MLKNSESVLPPRFLVQPVPVKKKSHIITMVMLTVNNFVVSNMHSINIRTKQWKRGQLHKNTQNNKKKKTHKKTYIMNIKISPVTGAEWPRGFLEVNPLNTELIPICQ